MKLPTPFLALTCLLLGLTAIAVAQENDPEARAAIAGGAPQFAAHAPMNVNRFQPAQLTIGSGVVLDATNGMALGNVGSGQSDLKGNAANTPRSPSAGRTMPMEMRRER